MFNYNLALVLCIALRATFISHFNCQLTLNGTELGNLSSNLVNLKENSSSFKTEAETRHESRSGAEDTSVSNTYPNSANTDNPPFYESEPNKTRTHLTPTTAENSFIKTTENSIITNAENSFKSTAENSFITNTENSFKTNAENSLKSTAENSFIKTTENSFITTAENSFITTAENSFITTAENSFKSTAENTFNSTAENSFKSTAENTFNSTAENSFITNTENSLKTTPENSFITNTENSLKTTPENSFITNTENSLKSTAENSLKTTTENSFKTTAENSYETKSGFFGNTENLFYVNDRNKTTTDSPTTIIVTKTTTENLNTTTKVSLPTTEIPITTTNAPITTTKIPITTTKVPITTTKIPITTTTETTISSPGPCVNFKASEVNSTFITVTWEAPSNGSVHGYVISIQSEIETVNVTFHTFNGLRAYLNYTIQLYAFNLNGNETLTGNVTRLVVTTSVDKPETCEEFKIDKIGSHDVIVTWKKPNVTNGPIDGFLLKWREIDNNDTEIRLIDRTLIRYELELKPYTNYEVSIAAFNSVQNSSNLIGPFIEETFRTNVYSPSECRDLTYDLIGSTNVSLSWEAPNESNGPIDGYGIIWASNDGNKSQSGEEYASGTDYVIVDLKPYTEYVVSVLAYNNGADGLKWPGNATRIKVKTAVSAPSEPLNIETDFNNSTKLIRVTWSKPGTPNGPIDGYEIIWQQDEWKPGDPQLLLPVRSLINETSYEFLASFWRSYVINVTAYNLDVQGLTLIGKTSSKNPETPYGKPFKPLNVMATSLSDSSINVTWHASLPLTGPTWYRIRVTESWGDDNDDVNCFFKSIPGKVIVRLIDVTRWNTNYQVVQNLAPFKCYDFVVIAVVGDSGHLETESSNPAVTRTLDGIPPFPTSPLKSLGKNETTITFFVPRNYLVNSNGSAWNFAVRVQIGVDPNDKSFTPRRGYLVEDDVIVSWEMARKNSTIKLYQASPPNWKPDKESSFGCSNYVISSIHGSTCVLGAEEDCAGVDYCNGKLQPGTSYRIFVRKYTRGGFADSTSLIVTTESTPSRNNSSSAALTTAIVIVTFLLAAAVAGYVALRQGYFRKKCPSILKYMDNEENDVQLNQVGDSKNRSIKVSEFKNDFRSHMANSSFGYANEFEKLKRISPDHPKDTGLNPDNKTKNRYINIIPFDHTRVKLLPVNDDETSDYINASFIPGANWTKEYIACQGPLPVTVNDFWRMVWENQIQVIVMLTQCIERGRTKCEEYWPKDNRGQSYGDLTIKLDHCSKLTHYTVRQFSIILNRKRLRVSQMHYTRWPDMGNPETPDDLIDFARAVRDQPNVSSQHSPLLVHCSAGVGRTGTFITVDRLMHELEQKRSEWIDVLGTVLDLRNSRLSMVQTEDQYVYIHQCVNRLVEELGKKKRTTDETDGETHQAIYANTPDHF